MAQPNTSQLYVCELSNGFIKVGRSKNNAESRLRAHAAIARLIGEEPRRSVIYECKTRSNKHESMLIKKCVEHGGKNISKEWFTDISFDTASMLALECASIEFEQKITESGNIPDCSMFDGLMPIKDIEWIIALRHAKTIQEIFTENLVSHDNFENIGSYEISIFELFCAIFLYKNDEISHFYQCAVNSLNSGDFSFCDDMVKNGAQKAIKLLTPAEGVI